MEDTTTVRSVALSRFADVHYFVGVDLDRDGSKLYRFAFAASPPAMFRFVRSIDVGVDIVDFWPFPPFGSPVDDTMKSCKWGRGYPVAEIDAHGWLTVWSYPDFAHAMITCGALSLRNAVFGSHIVERLHNTARILRDQKNLGELFNDE